MEPDPERNAEVDLSGGSERTYAEKVIHRITMGLLAVLLVAAGSVFAYILWGRSSSSPPSTWSMENQRLEGMFRSLGVPQAAELASWQITPTACLDGKERGFEGIAFTFSSGPVQELRLDTSRPNDSVIELRFVDPSTKPFRVRERDCARIDGAIRRSSAVLNRRHMFRLIGSIELACPTQGLEGKAVFDGCLPQTTR